MDDAVVRNPLAEAPSPIVVNAVKRFGKPGLVISAVGCWVKRNLLS